MLALEAARHVDEREGHHAEGEQEHGQLRVPPWLGGRVGLIQRRTGHGHAAHRRGLHAAGRTVVGTLAGWPAVAVPVTVAAGLLARFPVLAGVVAGVVAVAVGSGPGDEPGVTVPVPEVPGGRAEVGMPNADAGPQLPACGT